MKKGLYVVFDKLAKEAGPIFEAKNDDVAVRNFKRMLQENKSLQVAEFDLVRIGTFDSEDLGSLQKDVTDPLDPQLELDFVKGDKK